MRVAKPHNERSEEHTSELQSHSEISYAVFCLKKKKKNFVSVHALRSALNNGTSLCRFWNVVEHACSRSYQQTCFFFFLMIRRPPRSTLILTLFPTRRSSDLGLQIGDSVDDFQSLDSPAKEFLTI